MYTETFEQRIVNFTASKNLTIKSTVFPQRNIRKFTWTPPDGKTHSQIDSTLRRNSIVLEVRSFRTAQFLYRDVQSLE
jgi:hypothetical protein